MSPLRRALQFFRPERARIAGVSVLMLAGIREVLKRCVAGYNPEVRQVDPFS